MLSSVPFEEFSKEAVLESIDDPNLTVFALLNHRNRLGSTQIHKLIFLAFAEGRILMPFSFAKWSYGPYSEGLQTSLMQLQKQNLVKMNKEKVIDHDKNSWVISPEGQKVVELNKQKIVQIEKLIERTLKEHDEGAISLEKYCYDNFFLKPEGKTGEDWKASIKQKIEDLRVLLESRKKEIESIDEIEDTKKSIILSSFDYMDSLLQKIFSLKDIDQVIQGVLLKNLEEYINLWGEVLRLAKDDSTEQMKLNLYKIREIFRFVNEVAYRYSVFESVFNSQEESG